MKSARLLAAALLSIAAFASAAPATGRGIPWNADLNGALAQARKAKKPVLLEFYADWCGPCQGMKQVTFQDPEVVRLSGRFVPVRVDRDANRPLAKKYQVPAIPHVVVLSPEGKVVARVTGYQEPPQFAGFLRQALSQK